MNLSSMVHKSIYILIQILNFDFRPPCNELYNFYKYHTIHIESVSKYKFNLLSNRYFVWLLWKEVEVLIWKEVEVQGILI